MLRTLPFNIYYYVVTITAAIVAVPLLLMPGNKLLWCYLTVYSKLVRFGFKHLNRSDLDVTGLENLPNNRPFIIAAKHSSEGDSILMLNSVGPFRAVAWKGLTKIPLVGLILKKIDAIFVETCGAGQTDKNRLHELALEAKAENMPLLIYPEGRLVRLSEDDKLKSGVFYLYEELGIPVVTMASSLGNIWQARDLKKASGTATFEFHEAIQPGMAKEEFMALLTTRIKDRSSELFEKQRSLGQGLS